LSGLKRGFDVYTCVGELPEVIGASLGIDEVERFVPSVEAIRDERAKHAVVLVHAVEERTHVAVFTEAIPGHPQERVAGVHVSPHPGKQESIPVFAISDRRPAKCP
jgi:hypothetical protein